MLAYGNQVCSSKPKFEWELTGTAVVYLKNRASRGWTTSDELPHNKKIPQDEKANLRNEILSLLATSTSQIRLQLIPMLQKILNTDFPTQWPSYFDRTMQLLNTNEANSVYAGLQCMVALCRLYRFKSGETRTDFNQIVDASFPRLLEIANGLVQERSLEAWEMLHIIMKAFKQTIYVGYRRPHHSNPVV